MVSQWHMDGKAWCRLFGICTYPNWCMRKFMPEQFPEFNHSCEQAEYLGGSSLSPYKGQTAKRFLFPLSTGLLTLQLKINQCGDCEEPGSEKFCQKGFYSKLRNTQNLGNIRKKACWVYGRAMGHIYLWSLQYWLILSFILRVMITLAGFRLLCQRCHINIKYSPGLPATPTHSIWTMQITQNWHWNAYGWERTTYFPSLGHFSSCLYEYRHARHILLIRRVTDYPMCRHSATGFICKVQTQS